MFVFQVAMFLLATIQEAARLRATAIFIHTLLIEHQEVPLIVRQSLVEGYLRAPNLIIRWVGGFQRIFGDIVVVWRAYVLLQHRRRLVIAPSTLLLSSLASLLASWIIKTIVVDTRYNGLINNLNNIGFGLSLSTNVVATALIGYICWLHLRDIRVVRKLRPSQVEQVLVILVESGIVFCLAQAIDLGLSPLPDVGVPGSVNSNAAHILGAAYQGLTAIYPTIVIALVNNQRTLDYMYFTAVSLQIISHNTDLGRETTPHFAEPEQSTTRQSQ
ncbi:hypothetical protein BDZ94DRAFT_1316658 [Collybia nuda]|uniref:Uncharacterized protein n=1 Tax=Collybia nuda TaxID=64659 RepID=A0A9P5YIV1_9AGAR|nr:hypothetical protein BDZ94DRAFT_1316658 [Collybia nuda]